MSVQTLIQDLQKWYHTQCNDSWEHSYGVTIETLDNPGWSLKVDLTDTILSQKEFNRVRHGCDGEDESLDWIDCRVLGNQFVGCGGTHNLSELIQVFLDWAKTERN